MSTLSTSAQRRRSPFDAQFDALVRGAFGAPVATSGRPAAEIDRDGDDAVVRIDLPGLVIEDVTVEVDGDSLVVRGERKDSRAEGGRGRSEVRYGEFRRAFTLPAQVAADAVSATYDAGVLTVRVAGAHTANQPTRITVTGATVATAGGGTAEVTAAE